MSGSKPLKTLVICVALDGYQYLYNPIIESQKAYAARNGYEFWLINRPLISGVGYECAWLKLYLILEAFKKGYELVLSIDSDAEIKIATPKLESILQNDKKIYMAKGFSGRYNSGVIILQNSPAALSFVEAVIELADKPVDTDAWVGWGENGQVIQVAKNNDAVAELPSLWNNNSRPDLEDYIRHYSKGPLFTVYKPNLMRRIQYKSISVIAKIARRLVVLAGVTEIRKKHAFLICRVRRACPQWLDHP